ncbi:MAG TPA: hypothetical protein VHE30_16375 [Polyangiaceae bacterium]|nr:hypothetical protein [Polyangiaceae bacterium]
MVGRTGFGVLGACLVVVGCGGSSSSGTGQPGPGAGRGSGGAQATEDSGIRVARGAATIQVSAGANACPQAGEPLSAPPGPAGAPGAVADALTCNLSSSTCDPQAYLVEDGSDGAAVACTVSGGGGSYDVSVALVSSPRMSFRASGTVTMVPDGVSGMGTLQLSQSGANLPGSALLGTCQVDIKPNLGHIEPGSIWARFACDRFADPNAAGGESCTAAGAFFFTDCER